MDESKCSRIAVRSSPELSPPSGRSLPLNHLAFPKVPHAGCCIRSEELEKRVKELLPPAWSVLGRFRWSGREARLALGRIPEEAELQSVTRRLHDELGIF